MISNDRVPQGHNKVIVQGQQDSPDIVLITPTPKLAIVPRVTGTLELLEFEAVKTPQDAASSMILMAVRWIKDFGNAKIGGWHTRASRIRPQRNDHHINMLTPPDPDHTAHSSVF